MAWEKRRNNCQYFYAAVREGSRVRKVYLGAAKRAVRRPKRSKRPGLHGPKRSELVPRNGGMSTT